MVSSGPFRLLLAPVAALLCLLALSATATLAEEVLSCSVQVAPRAAPAGSVFVFSGTGFKPTKMTLQKDHSEPIIHDIEVGDADPWEVTVRSRTGDEGTWTATFSDAVTNCEAKTSFRVTLSNTDALSDLKGTAGGGSQPLLLYLVVVVSGFTGWPGDRTRSSRSVKS